MQKKVTLLICSVFLISNALFGADASHWSADYDAYQDPGDIHKDPGCAPSYFNFSRNPHVDKFHHAIRTSNKNAFDECLKEINNLSDDQQREILNRKYGNLPLSPHHKTCKISWRTARQVLILEEECDQLEHEAPTFCKNSLMCGAAIGAVIGAVYGLCTGHKKLKKWIAQTVVGAITGGSLVYCIAQARAHSVIREAKNEKTEKEAAFSASQAIYSTLINDVRVDIIRPDIAWGGDGYKIEAPKLRTLLSPLFEETAKVTRERFPINDEMITRICQDEQAHDVAKYNRLTRLKDILLFYHNVTLNTDSNDEAAQKNAYLDHFGSIESARSKYPQPLATIIDLDDDDIWD